MALVQQIQTAVAQAFNAVSDFKVSVALSKKTLGAVDAFTGARQTVVTTQTVNALVGKIDTEYTAGRPIQHTTLYFDDVPLTLDIGPQDTATFNGQDWTIEGPIDYSSPEFVRSVRVRLP